MAPIKPNPAKVLLREEIAKRIAALSTDEKKRQSQIVFEKILCTYNSTNLSLHLASMTSHSRVSTVCAVESGMTELKRGANLAWWSCTRKILFRIEIVINHPWYKSSKRVALFMSTEDEIDTAPLIEHVKARGAAAFVPQYAGGNMRMLRVEPDDEKHMAITKHGIAQHSKEQVREEALEGGGLDLIIAPGVAFSKSGGRVGHGGGYYDRYITKARSNTGLIPKVVAVAFNCQVVDEVPMDEHDQKIEAVISPDS